MFESLRLYCNVLDKQHTLFFHYGENIMGSVAVVRRGSRISIFLIYPQKHLAEALLMSIISMFLWISQKNVNIVGGKNGLI